MLRCPSLVVGLCAGLFASPWLQDPAKPIPVPTPPASGAPAAPAQTNPATTETDTRKVVPGRPLRHPLEGVYVLRRRVIDSRPEANPGKGYLAITNRHLFLTVAAPGPDREQPLVRSSVRTWAPQRAGTATTIELGFFNDRDGELHLEPPGTVEVRRIELIQGGVRVNQDERSWLEFERVE